MSNLDVLASYLASSVRGWRGTMAEPAARQPIRPLELYEFEGCPFCRVVREAFTVLDIDVLIKPCPKGGSRYREDVERLGGKQQFPYLEDPNTGDAMYEAQAIVEHLFRSYGGRAPPARPFGGELTQLTSQAATVLRGFKGVRARASRPPYKPLELYSFESSPYARRVRELLCELEIAYFLRSFGKAVAADLGPPWVRAHWFPKKPVYGRNRRRMNAAHGRTQVPFLIDPNTGAALYESDAIRHYLLKHYAAG